MKEIWELYTKDIERSGIFYERGSDAEIPDGLYVLAVEIWIKVGKDKLLFTRRHPNKYKGLMWETPGGGLLAEEDGISGARRELMEETGIDLCIEEFALLGRHTNHQTIAESYLVRLEKLPELSLQPSEVIDARLVSDADIMEMWELLTPGTQTRYNLYKNQIFN